MPFVDEITWEVTIIQELMCDMNKMQKIVCKIRSKQGHQEFSPNNDENKSI